MKHVIHMAIIPLMTLLILIPLITMTSLNTYTDSSQGKEPARGHKPLPSQEQIDKLPPDGGLEFNRLIHETSPYLRQHARNPVNWYPWGPEAFDKAKKEDKPVFLSIGYSTCHWCHVMEKESFERNDVAKIINEHYVAIKVDREERPDIDDLFMITTQLITGRGGWPNSVWLTPSGKPWYAGTYFPREDSQGRAGFKTMLKNLAKAWKKQRAEIDEGAESISSSVRKLSSGQRYMTPTSISQKHITNTARSLAMALDPETGGFSGAPKFPPHSILKFLLADYSRTKDHILLEKIKPTLEAMAWGGIHDHIGGGFHRYSTDSQWFLPHFEKMLYDNAQLARVYTDAYIATDNEQYREIALRIFEWVLREMRDKDGGFHSALDADSEGHEGLFYLWRYQEILKVLGKEEGSVFCKIYNISKDGNYREEATGKQTGTNIPFLNTSIDEIASETGVKPKDLIKLMAQARSKLLAVRVKRVWPHRDDKVIASWNGLMIGSLAHGGRLLKDPRLTKAAVEAADFVMTKMVIDGKLRRTYRNKKAKLNAYLDDYAFIADGLLELYTSTGNKRWLHDSKTLANTILKHYQAKDGRGFYLTSDDHEKLLGRTRDPSDSAIPSGNAVAASVLIRLHRHTKDKAYMEAALRTLQTFSGIIVYNPRTSAAMLEAASEYLQIAGPIKARVLTIAITPSKTEVSPGETLELKTAIDIAKPWHINPSTKTKDNLSPTQLTVTGDHITKSHTKYPEPVTITLPGDKQPIACYQGGITIRTSVQISDKAKPGPVELHIKIQSQPCSDNSCLAPETNDETITIMVKR